MARTSNEKRFLHKDEEKSRDLDMAVVATGSLTSEFRK